MHIGLIAKEFPPAVGGMEAVARNLAIELSGTDRLTVFTKEGRGLKGAPFEQRPVLTGDLTNDLRHLVPEQPNVWLALNGGYAAIADQLAGPMAVYCHGNDVLRLNVSYRRAWQERIRRAPLIWRYRKQIVRPLRRRRMRRGLRMVRQLFANSVNTAQLIRGVYGCDAPEVTVLPPGVDEVYFSRACSEDGRSSSRIRLLTVSRLQKSSARKNVEGVIRGIATLPPQLEWEYTVIGDGDDRPRLERLVGELALGHRVFFRGRVSNEELMEAYAGADLFVLASKATTSDVEGFGIVYIESSATGTPVLGSREGGATDAICDGVNGVLVDHSDPESIAQGIQRFVSMRNGFTMDRIRGFAEQFRWPQIAGRLRNHLVRLCG